MSAVQRLFIPGPAGRLEAALRPGEGPACAVLAHPHPVHGGTLGNPVIFHADRTLNRAGLATLRFNFRGVGGSEGTHDEGRGEVEDVGAAVQWLQALLPERRCVLVGYSFGSWCSIRYAVAHPDVAAVVAVGLPVRKYRFDMLAELRRPCAVVQPEYDEFGPPEEVRVALQGAHPPARVDVVPGATHLLPGRAPEAGTKVAEAVAWCLSLNRAGGGPAGSPPRSPASPRA
ncbi:MAG TPA: alpha/beta fold hydrolase [Candidatus Polarisedimenticolaceae bacterium]|nr:alpha/beta fold hydrolase [Candidatus Polarisedimenticolaceae bacterium]